MPCLYEQNVDVLREGQSGLSFCCAPFGPSASSRNDYKFEQMAQQKIAAATRCKQPSLNNLNTDKTNIAGGNGCEARAQKEMDN